MAEEDEEKKEEGKQKPEPRPAPQTASEFLQAHFGKLLACIFFLLLLAYYPLNDFGSTVLDDNGFLIGVVMVFAAFVLVPQMLFFRKKQARPSEIEPLNPLEEIPLLQESFAKLGRDVRIERVESDPFEGEGAGSPEVYHYFGVEVLGDGTRRPFSVSQGALTRFATKFSNTRYIETSVFSSAGTRKRPSEPQPRSRPLFVQKPTEVRVVVPERRPVGGEKEEEEEEE